MWANISVWQEFFAVFSDVLFWREDLKIEEKFQINSGAWVQVGLVFSSVYTSALRSAPRLGFKSVGQGI